MILRRTLSIGRLYSTSVASKIFVSKNEYVRDSFTNTTPKIISHINKNLHLEKDHPISFICQRIVNYFYDTFKDNTGNPVFSVYDCLSPIVTTTQNFDSLLVPKDHVSRSKSDCYYLNSETLLRSHMTAHQTELMAKGLSNFLMVGDVYRRDEIDATHYPVFHQLDAVRLLNSNELFVDETLEIMEKSDTNHIRTDEKQEMYTLKASKMTEEELKKTLEGLVKRLFGTAIQYRWVEAYFPFTHPSFELEIKLNEDWVEVLGCGIMEYKLLDPCCRNKIGWAFGLGLERLAMILYQIPDIRVFWSQDAGFLNQFSGKKHTDDICYKNVSKYPPCINDISFWIPEDFTSGDFYDMVRDIGGEMVEQVKLIDVFKHPKTGLVSHCYRIHYRDMLKTLTKQEVDSTHKLIAETAGNTLKVTMR